MQPQHQTAPNNISISEHNRKRTRVALWLMIGPGALLVSTFVLSLILAALLSGQQPQGTTGLPSSDSQSVRALVNIIVFIAGALGVLTFVPGLIVGIILLATRK